MNTSQLSAELRKWVNEFEAVSKTKVGTFTVSVIHKRRKWWKSLFKIPQSNVVAESECVTTSYEFHGMVGLYAFLSSRLAEIGVAETPKSVVTAIVGGTARKVEITGLRGRHMTYKETDGSVGFGLILSEDIPDSKERHNALMYLEEKGLAK